MILPHNIFALAVYVLCISNLQQIDRTSPVFSSYGSVSTSLLICSCLATPLHILIEINEYEVETHSEHRKPCVCCCSPLLVYTDLGRTFTSHRSLYAAFFVYWRIRERIKKKMAEESHSSISTRNRSKDTFFRIIV
jgi:hypothetical protein